MVAKGTSGEKKYIPTKDVRAYAVEMTMTFPPHEGNKPLSYCDGETNLTIFILFLNIASIFI